MADLALLADGLTFGEQPRWHEDRLRLSDWGTRDVVALDASGRRQVVLRAPSFPCCVDRLPDGRLLVVSGGDSVLVRREADGAWLRTATCDASDPPAGNELVVDPRGNASVNGGGFDLVAGAEFRPGIVAVVTRRRRSPGGGRSLLPERMHRMADVRTLIVAESYADRLTAFDIGDDANLSNRRVWADLGDGVPDGICADAEGRSGTPMCPTRGAYDVRHGGDILATVDVDRGCFACALGGTTGPRCSSWRPNGTAPVPCSGDRRRDRC